VLLKRARCGAPSLVMIAIALLVVPKSSPTAWMGDLIALLPRTTSIEAIPIVVNVADFRVV